MHTTDNLRCLEQERAYTDGWRYRVTFPQTIPAVVIDGLHKFRRLGWADADRRIRFEAMRKEATERAF